MAVRMLAMPRRFARIAGVFYLLTFVTNASLTGVV